MKQPLLHLAKHNYAAIADLALLFSKNGYGGPPSQAMTSVAHLVRELFEAMAWSDRHTSYQEYDLLDCLIQEDEANGGCLKAIFPQDVVTTDTNRLPACVESALAFDNRYGTSFTEMLIRHIENLGTIVLVVDGVLSSVETQHYESFMGRLRSLIAEADRTTSMAIA